MVLLSFGAVLGALTGTVCLMLIGTQASREWSSDSLIVSIWFGSYVGAPLGALVGPILGWFVLRRVPAALSLLYAPLGTLVGSLVALLVGWTFDDISDGIGIFYLIGGAITGLVLTAFVLRGRYSGRGDENRLKDW